MTKKVFLQLIVYVPLSPVRHTGVDVSYLIPISLWKHFPRTLFQIKMNSLINNSLYLVFIIIRRDNKWEIKLGWDPVKIVYCGWAFQTGPFTFCQWQKEIYIDLTIIIWNNFGANVPMIFIIIELSIPHSFDFISPNSYSPNRCI